jgi:peroxiredoxin
MFTLKTQWEATMLQNIEDNKLHIGDKAPDFGLPGVDGGTYSLADFDDARLLIVVFTCNHCPYAQAYEDRLMDIQRDYREQGVRIAAICSNDEEQYPEDGFDQMAVHARERGFNFPYLRDDSQDTADAYGAQCTPEIFVFDDDRTLRYHGRIDDNWQEPDKVTKRDLRDALDALLEGREVAKPENLAIGCSIKWRK